MRLHIISLPNTSTTKAYSWSPYTQKIRSFSKMMIDLGHETYIYGGPDNDAMCTEHISCIELSEQTALFPDRFPSFDPESEGRSRFMHRVRHALMERSQPGDVLCLTEGSVQADLLTTFPDLIPMEIGVGYSATCTARRVFESYAWQHYVYAQQKQRFSYFLDGVIPNAYDPDDFPLGDHLGDYLIYVGRLDIRKGIEIACDVAIAADKELVICGTGDFSLSSDPHINYYGSVGYETRAELVGNALALIQPTMIVEPFGGSVVEAQLYGTPVLTTDWGAFTETVDDWYSGFRCRSMSEFLVAIGDLDELDFTHEEIREHALDLWSIDRVKFDWDQYLDRVLPVGTPGPPHPPGPRKDTRK